jgi:hypothetical protein
VLVAAAVAETVVAALWLLVQPVVALHAAADGAAIACPSSAQQHTVRLVSAASSDQRHQQLLPVQLPHAVA